jgi:hypothetical protein
MKSLFQLIFLLLKKVRWIIKHEAKYPDHALPLPQKIWGWRHGFLSSHPAIYRWTPENKHLFIDHFSYRQKHPINGVFSKLIDNKAYLPVLTHYTTDIYVVIEKGRVVYSKGIAPDQLFSGLKSYLDIHPKGLIIKPLNESVGRGVEALAIDNWEHILQQKLSNKETFLINERLNQLPYSQQIFPNSLNTIRMVFFRDWDTHVLKLANCSHKFGTQNSGPADNSGRGGFMTELNPSTGIMGKSYVYDQFKIGGWYEVHPDTSAQIEGIQVPYWQERLAQVTAEIDKMSWLRLGGVDVVFTEDSFKILEINSLPGMALMQINGPLLANEDFRKFYQAI